MADRVGRRAALTIFTGLAMAGYAIYAFAGSWPVVFVGLFGVMAWKAGAFPTTFAVIGDSLPRDRRAVAFSIQSILVRVPRVIGAPLGGALIATLGVVLGIKVALIVTIALAGAVPHSSILRIRRIPADVVRPRQSACALFWSPCRFRSFDC